LGASALAARMGRVAKDLPQTREGLAAWSALLQEQKKIQEVINAGTDAQNDANLLAGLNRRNYESQAADQRTQD